MNVVLVAGNADPVRDGVADYTLRLADALGGVPVVAGGPAAVARRLRVLRPDVVHVQFAPSAYGYSPAVGLLPGVLPRATRLVTTLHEYGWWAWPRWVPAAFWRRVEGRWDRETLRLVPASDRLVVTNPAHARVLASRLGRTAVTLPVGANVPTPLDGSPPASGADVRARYGLPPDRPLAVFFGFVHPVKGVRYLYEALALLPQLHAAVVGGFTSLALPAGEADAFRAELAGHAAAAGVADRVTVTGHLPGAEVSALLSAADLAVLPFTAGVTTKSGALVAVLAHRLPTVVTAADPPDPALVDGRTAVVVDRVRDGDALAAGIRRLLADRALAERVAAGGADLVADRDWSSIAAAHRSLYAELVRT